MLFAKYYELYKLFIFSFCIITELISMQIIIELNLHFICEIIIKKLLLGDITYFVKKAENSIKIKKLIIFQRRNLLLEKLINIIPNGKRRTKKTNQKETQLIQYYYR